MGHYLSVHCPPARRERGQQPDAGRAVMVLGEKVVGMNIERKRIQEMWKERRQL